MEFSDILKILRRKNNLRQEDLANVLDIDRTVISDWENKVKFPQYQQLIKIAEYFDISLDELTGRCTNKEISRLYNLEEKCNVAGNLSIADLRQEFGVTFAELLELLEVSRSTLVNWETKGLPNFEAYKKIIEFFELDKDMIMNLK